MNITHIMRRETTMPATKKAPAKKPATKTPAKKAEKGSKRCGKC